MSYSTWEPFVAGGGHGQQLRAQGFVLLKGALSPTDVEHLEGCFDDQLIDYARMRGFIDNVMIRKTNEAMGQGWDMKYVKYRVSDNNNADAGGFHRDVVCQRNKDEPTYPIYTCLTYLDKTTMEVIPGTHTQHVEPLSNALTIYRKNTQVIVEPGDVLLFHATVLHRGIFTERMAHRRLAQVFDVYKNNDEYAAYAHRVLHILGKETFTTLADELNKNPAAIWALSKLSYLNGITGYGYEHRILNRCGMPPQFTHMSSEGFRERLEVVPGTWQPINKYIVVNETHNLPSRCYDDYKFYCYNRQFIIYSTCIFSLVFLIVCMLVLFGTQNRKGWGQSVARHASSASKVPSSILPR